jgi:hypothetical protein
MQLPQQPKLLLPRFSTTFTPTNFDHFLNGQEMLLPLLLCAVRDL